MRNAGVESKGLDPLSDLRDESRGPSKLETSSATVTTQATVYSGHYYDAASSIIDKA